MAVRKNPSKGGKPDKLMRDALNLELHQQVQDPLSQRKRIVKRLRLVARALVDAAIDGDVAAIKEINDRMDGKTMPVVAVGTDGNGLSLEDLVHLSYQAGAKAKKPEEPPK